MAVGEQARILRALAEAVDVGEPVAIATVVATRRSTPRHAGTKMLVFDDGRLVGTVGGGEMESRVIEAARRALRSGRPEMLAYTLLDPEKGDPGVCGGEVEIYVEPIMPPPTLYVFGCGHVGRALVELAHWLGFRTVAVDDRPEQVTAEVLPLADVRSTGPVEEVMADQPIRRDAAVVLVTRSVHYDVATLPALASSEAAYVGVMGSARRWRTTRQGLEEAGVAAEVLDRIHAPVGIDIGAETVEEIAMSIMSEIVAGRRRGAVD